MSVQLDIIMNIGKVTLVLSALCMHKPDCI